MSSTNSLDRALKRLAASDTPRKRANALKAFAAAVKQLQASVEQQYPKLRADGSAIVKRKVKGARCPLCKVPMKSFRMLVTHLFQNHHVGSGGMFCNDRHCPCGKTFRSPSHLARHLTAVGDLRVHFAEAAIKKAAGMM